MKLSLLGMAIILLMPLHSGYSYAAETDWDAQKGLALAEAHRDTVRECKSYAKYRLDEKFEYCEKIDEQRVRVRSLIDWIQSGPQGLSDTDLSRMINYLNEATTDMHYLREVGVFDKN